MANANASRSIDGTTVSITFTAKHAERAYSAIQYLVYGTMDDIPHSWEDIGTITIKGLDAWVEKARVAADLHKPLLRQFEDAGVVDYSSAMHIAFRAAMDAVDWDRDVVVDPTLPEPTTGPVTIAWTRAGFEWLAAEFEARAQTHDDREAHAEAAAVLRDQIEATR